MKLSFGRFLQPRLGQLLAGIQVSGLRPAEVKDIRAFRHFCAVKIALTYLECHYKFVFNECCDDLATSKYQVPYNIWLSTATCFTTFI